MAACGGIGGVAGNEVGADIGRATAGRVESAAEQLYGEATTPIEDRPKGAGFNDVIDLFD
jgi:hypothetical protein